MMQALAQTSRAPDMMDLVFVVLIVAFFAASVGLVRFCASLRRAPERT